MGLSTIASAPLHKRTVPPKYEHPFTRHPLRENFYKYNDLTHLALVLEGNVDYLDELQRLGIPFEGPHLNNAQEEFRNVESKIEVFKWYTDWESLEAGFNEKDLANAFKAAWDEYRKDEDARMKKMQDMPERERLRDAKGMFCKKGV
ncbi:MAG: hypothetical protein Q9168_008392 [Polycauliona sp. 1 TL-2023]